jgi:hypothetical protein
MSAQLKLRDYTGQTGRTLFDGIAGQAVEVYLEVIDSGQVVQDPFAAVALQNVGKYTNPVWVMFGPSGPSAPTLDAAPGTPPDPKSFTPNYPGRWLVRVTAEPIILVSGAATTGTAVDFTALFEILDPAVVGHPAAVASYPSSVVAPNETTEYNALEGWARSVESYLTTVSKQVGGRRVVSGVNASGQVLTTTSVVRLHQNALARWKSVNTGLADFQNFVVQFDRAYSTDSGINIHPLFLVVYSGVGAGDRTYVVWDGLVPYDTATLGNSVAFGDKVYLTAAGGLSTTAPAQGPVRSVGVVLKTTNVATPDTPGVLYFTGQSGAVPGVVTGPATSTQDAVVRWSSTDGEQVKDSSAGPWVNDLGHVGINMQPAALPSQAILGIVGDVFLDGTLRGASAAKFAEVSSSPTTGASEGAVYVDSADGHLKFREHSDGVVSDLSATGNPNSVIGPGQATLYAIPGWANTLGTLLGLSDLRIGVPAHGQSAISTDDSASNVATLSVLTGESQGAGQPGNIRIIAGASGSGSTAPGNNNLAADVRVQAGASSGDPAGGPLYLLGGNKEADPASSARSAGPVVISGGSALSNVPGDGGYVTITGGVASSGGSSAPGDVLIQNGAATGLVAIGGTVDPAYKIALGEATDPKGGVLLRSGLHFLPTSTKPPTPSSLQQPVWAKYNRGLFYGDRPTAAYVDITSVIPANHSGGYQVLSPDYIIHVVLTVGLGQFLVKLPAASVSANRAITIKDSTGLGSSSSYVDVLPVAGDLIEGLGSIRLENPWAEVTVYCDGTVWFVR